MVKQNLCVYGLLNLLAVDVGKCVADDLGMYFADVGALIEFDLIDKMRAEVLCGKDYVKKVEGKTIKNVSTFENTLFVCDYSLLNDEKNLEYVKKNSYCVYIKFSKANLEKAYNMQGLRKADIELKLNMMAIRDRLCKKYADIVVDCKSLDKDKIVENIKNKLMELLKNGN